MSDINILSCLHVDTTKLEEAKVVDETQDSITYEVKTRKIGVACPKCKNITSLVKDYTTKTYSFYGVGQKTIIINFKQKRLKCKNCGHTFVEENIFNKTGDYKLTKNLRIEIIKQLQNTRSVKSIANDFGISESIVYKVLDAIEPKHGPIGKIMCVDEFARVHVDGKLVLSAILVNGENKELVDILPSRKAKYVREFLYSLTQAEHEKIRYLSIDMREPYKEAFNTVLPNITVVVDRFHFVRYIIHALDKIRIRVMKTYDKESHEYYILKKFKNFILKTEVDDNNACLKIRHKEWKYETTAKKIVDIMLSYSDELKIAYNFLHSFMVSYKSWDYETAKIKLKKTIEFLEFHGEIEELFELGKLLSNWQTEIENSFLLVDGKTINNAICEGINRKIKSLKNVSFGITNFKHLRSRIFLIYRKFDEEK